MQKLSKHITIESELYDKVLSVAKDKDNTFSEEITLLTIEALEYRKKNKDSDIVEEEIKKIKWMIKAILSLLEQIYSDFNISPNNITDPKNCYALQEFYRKNRVSKLDD